MENQITTTGQRSSTGLTVIDAIQHPLKIVNSKDQDLINALGYCFAVLGLLEEHYPKGLRKSFLVEFIRENYKFYSVEEIKTAFTMLVKGEFGEKSPKHYNNFSPEYFGSVMVCYKIHREKACIDIHNKTKVNTVAEPYVPDNVQKVAIQREFDKVVIQPIFEKYKQFGKLEPGTTPIRFIYNSLVAYHKILEFSDVHKQQIAAQARVEMERKHEAMKTMQAVNYTQHKEKIKMISELYKPEIMDKEIVSECHLICVKLCFDKMIELKFNF